MNEGLWHYKVRNQFIKKYQKNYKVVSSHGNGKIPLYRGAPSRATFLSDADIVLIKNDKIVKIIEVQSTLSPKQAIGIIKSADLCDRCRINKKIYSLSSIELIIPYKKQKEKSKKPEQLELIKNNIKVDGCLKNVNFQII